VPCEVGGKPLEKDEVIFYSKDVSNWSVDQNFNKISRTFKLADFESAMIFVNKVANLANEEGHHPDIKINYDKVTLELSTHSIGGLSLNDFIVAAKIDKIKI